jgi:hypothetical protein
MRDVETAEEPRPVVYRITSLENGVPNVKLALWAAFAARRRRGDA